MSIAAPAAPTDLLAQWREEGYVIVRGIYDRARTERLRVIAERILGQWRERDPQTGAAAGPDAACMRHLNHPAYFAERRDEFVALMAAAADPAVLAVASTILDGEPLFRCTSLFFNPLNASLDGNWHRDTQFGTPDDAAERSQIERPDINGSGVQMQIALVPSDDVEYVPRSHLRWDSPEEYAIRKADGGRHSRSNAMPGALRIALEPGDAVLFNPYGHHRGRYHADKLRRTLMLTYTRRDQPAFDWFTDQPWFRDAGYLDGLDARTRAFFDDFVSIFAPQWDGKIPAAR